MPEAMPVVQEERAHDRVAERAFGRSAAVLVIVGVAAVVGGCGHETKVTRGGYRSSPISAGAGTIRILKWSPKPWSAKPWQNPWLGNFKRARTGSRSSSSDGAEQEP